MLIKIINCHKSEGIKSAAASPVLVPLRPAPELAGSGPGGRVAALLRGLRQGARVGRIAGLVLRLGRGRRVLVVAVVVAAAVALQRVLLARLRRAHCGQRVEAPGAGAGVRRVLGLGGFSGREIAVLPLYLLGLRRAVVVAATPIPSIFLNF